MEDQLEPDSFGNAEAVTLVSAVGLELRRQITTPTPMLQHHHNEMQRLLKGKITPHIPVPSPSDLTIFPPLGDSEPLVLLPDKRDYAGALLKPVVPAPDPEPAITIWHSLFVPAKKPKCNLNNKGWRVFEFLHCNIFAHN